MIGLRTWRVINWRAASTLENSQNHGSIMQSNLSTISGRVLSILFVAAALGACSPLPPKATATTGTNFDVFIPAGAQGFSLPANQKIVLGNAIAQAAPIYPAEMIQKNIPKRSVCLTIAIDGRGIAYENHPLYDMPGCPANAAAIESAFVTAARDAVMHWRFAPAIRCTFPKGVDARTMGNDCAEEGAKVEPISISLAFVFTFTQTHGVLKVHTGTLRP